MAGTGKSIGLALPTHALHSREVLRQTAVRAEVLAHQGNRMLLSAFEKTSSFRPLSSADQAMFEARTKARADAAASGQITIDVLHDRVFRVRYQLRESSPPHNSGLIAGEFPESARCQWQIESGQVEARTNAGTLVLHLDPWRWQWRSPGGHTICGAAGEEKNYFNQWDAYGLGVSRRLADDRPLATESFDLRPHEAIYGFGERFVRLNKVGQIIDLDMSDTKGVTTDRAYKNVSFFSSSLGYGVFLNHAARITAWVGAMSACDLQVGVDDDHIDYFVFIGGLKEILPLYTKLTGRGPVPPPWSFGFWQSKISYSSAEETLDLVREMRRHQVPCDVIHLDTHWFERNWFCDLNFSSTRFPDPAAWIRELRQLGVRVSLWQLPYIPEGSALFTDLAAVNGFVHRTDGSIYDIEITFVDGFHGTVGVIDFTNPRAVEIWQDYLRRLFRLGVVALKTDFGESAPIDGVYFDGTPGHRAHNLYPLLYNAAAAAAMDGESVLWARSACAGGQRFPIHWGGDSSPNSTNMIPQLEGGLSLGLSGFQFWSQDVGGFMGETNDRLLVRWLQWSIFLSHCRIHGFGRREFHRFSPETLQLCRELLELRYRLLPYLLGTADQCHTQSRPFARPLVLEYQADPNTWNLSDEFLCGESLLVAPMMPEENATRRVYLPPDVWYSWWTGASYDSRPSGTWLETAEELNRLPLFVRAGAIIPLGPAMNFVGEHEFSPLKILVGPLPADGARHFSFVLRSGARCEVTYRRENQRHTVTVVGLESIHVTVQAIDTATIITLNNP